jgi:hypothetical protein
MQLISLCFCHNTQVQQPNHTQAMENFRHNSNSRTMCGSIPAEVLPHLLRHICCLSEQSPKQAQRMLCSMLCTSKAVHAAAARHCQGLLRIRLYVERSSGRALQFAGWLRSNIALVKELHVDLPSYSKEVEKAFAAALQPVAAVAGGVAATAVAVDGTGLQCSVQLQSYICHTR